MQEENDEMALLAPILDRFVIAMCVMNLAVHPGFGSENEKSRARLSQRPASKSGASEIFRRLESIANLDDGKQAISVLNSRIVVKTTAIDEIVRKGPAVVPELIELMKKDAVTFDTFTRCYSACGQILRKVDPKSKVYWSGGCRLKQARGGMARIFPEGQIDERRFREKVVADIVDKHQQWEKTQRKK